MPLIDSSDADLDAFDRVCQRLGGFNDRVLPEWADGYLTALAAGPRQMAFEEWLPRFAGDAFERAFADPEDAAQARQALESRMRVLANHLDPEALLDQPEALRLQPLLAQWDDESREAVVREQGAPAELVAQFVTGGLWATGFFDALADFEPDWTPPPDTDDDERTLFEDLLLQVEILVLPEGHEDLKRHLEEAWKDRLPTREDLVDEACFAVQDLRVWWLDHAPRPAPRRVEAAPGRNEPCPCGSGLKYKKCHGKAG
ncbi:MAG: UPF0149 family protein [Proteobacteria bacterium]|nr:UPF0149 family protein [Pseudomonadota bacterium]